jgi:hypothetical protein
VKRESPLKPEGGCLAAHGGTLDARIYCDPVLNDVDFSHPLDPFSRAVGFCHLWNVPRKAYKKVAARPDEVFVLLQDKDNIYRSVKASVLASTSPYVLLSGRCISVNAVDPGLTRKNELASAENVSLRGERAYRDAKAISAEVSAILSDALDCGDPVNAYNLFCSIRPRLRDLAVLSSLLPKEFGVLSSVLASAYLSIAAQEAPEEQVRALRESVCLFEKGALTQADLDCCNDTLEDAGVDLDLQTCSDSSEYVIEIRKKSRD